MTAFKHDFVCPISQHIPMSIFHIYVGGDCWWYYSVQTGLVKGSQSKFNGWRKSWGGVCWWYYYIHQTGGRRGSCLGSFIRPRGVKRSCQWISVISSNNNRCKRWVNCCCSIGFNGSSSIWWNKCSFFSCNSNISGSVNNQKSSTKTHWADLSCFSAHHLQTD